MAAKKQQAVKQQAVKVNNRKMNVKIPKSVGVLGMTDKIYHRLMIQAIREQSTKKVVIDRD